MKTFLLATVCGLFGVTDPYQVSEFPPAPQCETVTSYRRVITWEPFTEVVPIRQRRDYSIIKRIIIRKIRNRTPRCAGPTVVASCVGTVPPAPRVMPPPACSGKSIHPGGIK